MHLVLSSMLAELFDNGFLVEGFEDLSKWKATFIWTLVILYLDVIDAHIKVLQYIYDKYYQGKK